MHEKDFFFKKNNLIFYHFDQNKSNKILSTQTTNLLVLWGSELAPNENPPILSSRGRLYAKTFAAMEHAIMQLRPWGSGSKVFMAYFISSFQFRIVSSANRGRTLPFTFYWNCKRRQENCICPLNLRSVLPPFPTSTLPPPQNWAALLGRNFYVIAPRWGF